MDPKWSTPKDIKNSPAYALGELRGVLVTFELWFIAAFSSYLTLAWREGAWQYEVTNGPLWLIGPLAGLALIHAVVWWRHSVLLKGLPTEE